MHAQSMLDRCDSLKIVHSGTEEVTERVWGACVAFLVTEATATQRFRQFKRNSEMEGIRSFGRFSDTTRGLSANLAFQT